MRPDRGQWDFGNPLVAFALAIVLATSTYLVQVYVPRPPIWAALLLGGGTWLLLLYALFIAVPSLRDMMEDKQRTLSILSTYFISTAWLFYLLAATGEVIGPPALPSSPRTAPASYLDLRLECFRAEKSETDLNYVWDGSLQSMGLLEYQKLDNLATLPVRSVANCTVSNDGSAEVFRVVLAILLQPRTTDMRGQSLPTLAFAVVSPVMVPEILPHKSRDFLFVDDSDSDLIFVPSNICALREGDITKPCVLPTLTFRDRNYV